MFYKVFCLVVFVFGFMNSATAVEEFSVTITDGQVKAMVGKAIPLVEEVTGRKYKTEANWKAVKRNIVRDVLIQELMPQIKKLLDGMGDDLISRQVEMADHTASQSVLGKYSFLTKELYIVPDNIKTVAEMLGIKDANIEEFVFLVVTHELVHALDDQYYNMQKKIESMDNAEKAQAFNALMEGHAVYVTNKIATNLKMSETAQNLAVRSAAGIQNEANRQQQQLFQSIYVKGAEFVEAVIIKNGAGAIDAAFAAPPVSTRQILNPEEYLNGSATAGIDYRKLLQKLEKELPIAEMRSQSIDIGSMVLQALIVSQGIPEKETVAMADNCLDGIVFSAVKQTLKPEKVSILIINFKDGETATKFDEMGEKITKSEIAQFTARLNTSYKLVKEENIKLDGFNFVRYRHSERKIDEDVTTDISVVGTIGNIYVEMGFKNMSGLAESDVLKFMGLISTDLTRELK